MENEKLIAQIQALQGEVLAASLVIRALLNRDEEVRRVLREDLAWFHNEALYSTMAESTRRSFDAEISAYLVEPLP